MENPPDILSLIASLPYLAIRVCATEQGMVFKVLSVTQGIQFHY